MIKNIIIASIIILVVILLIRFLFWIMPVLIIIGLAYWIYRFIRKRAQKKNLEQPEDNIKTAEYKVVDED